MTQWSFQFLGYIDATNSIVGMADIVIAGQEFVVFVQAFDQYNYSMIIYP